MLSLLKLIVFYCSICSVSRPHPEFVFLKFWNLFVLQLRFGSFEDREEWRKQMLVGIQLCAVGDQASVRSQGWSKQSSFRRGSGGGAGGGGEGAELWAEKEEEEGGEGEENEISGGLKSSADGTITATKDCGFSCNANSSVSTLDEFPVQVCGKRDAELFFSDFLFEHNT